MDLVLNVKFMWIICNIWKNKGNVLWILKNNRCPIFFKTVPFIHQLHLVCLQRLCQTHFIRGPQVPKRFKTLKSSKKSSSSSSFYISCYFGCLESEKCRTCGFQESAKNEFSSELQKHTRDDSRLRSSVLRHTPLRILYTPSSLPSPCHIFPHRTSFLNLTSIDGVSMWQCVSSRVLSVWSEKLLLHTICDLECRRSDWTIATLTIARDQNDILYCVVCSVRANILRVRGECMRGWEGEIQRQISLHINTYILTARVELRILNSERIYSSARKQSRWVQASMYRGLSEKNDYFAPSFIFLSHCTSFYKQSELSIAAAIQ